MWLPGRIHFCPADMESAPALKNRGITSAGNNTQWVKTHPVILLANS